jgi:putative SOS response-associated peptidase YedK
MCGRFTFQPTEAVYERFGISNRLDSLTARYNIAPGQMVPVIIAQSPRQIVPHSIGFRGNGLNPSR